MISTSNISIRSATLEDAQAIAAVQISGWQTSYKGIIDQYFLDLMSHEECIEWRRHILLNPRDQGHFLVALSGEDIVGFCDMGASLIKSSEYKGEVSALYILDEFKGYNIGFRLLQKASEYFGQQNLIPFIVWTLDANTPAKKFYEKLGGIPGPTDIKSIGGEGYAQIGYKFMQALELPREGGIEESC